MGTFKIVGIIILAIIIAFFIGAFFLPEKVEISKTETLSVSTPDVFKLVNDFHNWPQWSPWYDTAKAYIFTGSEFGVGAVKRWVDSKGQVGEREIIESIDNERIVVLTRFREEHSTAKMTFNFSSIDSAKTEVTISFAMDKQFSYPFGRYIAWMIQAGVDVSFPKALSNLKRVSELKN